MHYLNGKIAVVTGAGSGIGRELALQLNRAGCKLHISDISPDGLAGTADLLPRHDVPAESHILDVADKTAVHAWAERIGEVDGHVDVVINNAGVALMSTVEDMRYDDIEWLMGINFWGVVYGTQAFLPLLRLAPQGHLVNISSVFGLIGVPTQSAYNAAKFAVRGYTEALRQEMAGTNVHVCCVHPGGIKTNIARAARSSDTKTSADERAEAFDKAAGTPAVDAAKQIVDAIEQRRPRLLIGKDALVISLITRLFPVRYPRLMEILVKASSALHRS
ncbi:MAG: SDR family NAD(P)-dependent oxidoreductase [Halioglobus sp.]|nr:SDR family NAD(P)-dependent oxidoreductase [Halieaceae bacterium]MDG2411061.1 SDR family NAD(P)-dependent oxidoreductase [Halioglobus sp.]